MQPQPGGPAAGVEKRRWDGRDERCDGGTSWCATLGHTCE
jgi:hypothetical protein